MDGRHELVHELVILFAVQPGLLESEVVGVVDQLLVVCAHVHDDGEDAARVKAACGDVEVKLADGDSKAAHPKIAEAKDPGVVRFNKRYR